MIKAFTESFIVNMQICRHVTLMKPMCRVEKDSMKDTAITSPQTVVDTINNENKFLADNSSREMVEKDGTNDEKGPKKTALTQKNKDNLKEKPEQQTFMVS